MNALRGLALLLVFQGIGESITHALGWAIPGPVTGLILLLPVLAWRPLRAPVASAADGLLSNLSLLFVPAGVGVITHLALLKADGWKLLVIVILSTWIGMAVSALLLRGMPAASLPAPSAPSGPTAGEEAP